MHISQMALFAAGEQSDGDALLGFLLIVGVVWGIIALCSKKPKGYDVRVESRGKITPRR